MRALRGVEVDGWDRAVGRAFVVLAHDLGTRDIAEGADRRAPDRADVLVYATTHGRGTALARDAIALTTLATAPVLLALPVLLR